MMIPKGTHIRLDVWHSNRREEFWGEDVTGYPADIFAPERWDTLKERGPSAKSMLHFGFGHGARFCPGRSLGLLEVGLVVGALVAYLSGILAIRWRLQSGAEIDTGFRADDRRDYSKWLPEEVA